MPQAALSITMGDEPAAGAGPVARSGRLQLPEAHRRWVLYNALLGTAVVNLVLNAGPAWISTSGHRQVVLWSIPAAGRPSVLPDTIATLFVLPFMTCVMCSAAVHRSQRRGELPLLGSFSNLPVRLDRLPARVLLRGLVLGATAVLVIAPVVIAGLMVADPQGLSREGFTIYKALLGVGLGLFVTPLVAIRAMADPVRIAAIA